MASDHTHPAVCHCCDGVAATAPIEPENPPLSPEISYRSGTWQSFRETMLARLGSADAGSLRDLGTRDPQDPTIALIDAWAMTGDILTFYNERLMSEGLLRTAEELDSLHQLARLIGYQPGPGVAASADIAFTMDEAEGAPRKITLQAGIKVQSTPGPEEIAVIYETVDEIEARPAWNALRPRLDQTHILNADTTQLWFDGTTLAAAPGDGVQFGSADGSRFAIVHKVERRPGDRATDRDAKDFTILHVKQVPSDPLVGGAFVATAILLPPEPALTYWNRTLSAAELDAELTATGHDEEKVFEVYESIQETRPGALLFRARASMFGHNAPEFGALPQSLTGSVPEYEIEEDGDVVIKKMIDGPYKGLENLWADEDLGVLADGSVLHLEGAQPALAANSTVVLRDGNTWGIYSAGDVAETSYSRFSVNGKATRMDLGQTDGFTSMTIRGTVAYIGAELVPLARPPLTLSVSDGSAVLLELNTYAPGLQIGQKISLTGRRFGDADSDTTVMATLDEVSHEFVAGGATSIRFSPALGDPFRRDTVRINANVAGATHGESVAELLGDGDATRPFLSATLKQAPQTHVTDASPSGAAPTLEVRVSDIRWTRVDNLLSSGPEDRVYTTKVDAGGKTRVLFGDGATGARPPTGSQNIRATYRKELGLKGRVRAGVLNVLMSRPQGLSGAVNPLASSGGADPDSVDAIRSNAPLTVRTLDRVVSAEDYADFALGYAGIAKAEARLLADGVTDMVHLTVAADEGEQVLPGSKLHDGLTNAIANASDPYRTVLISSYRPATFRIGARVKIHADYLEDIVLAEIEDRLRARFGFDSGAFSDTVWKSEIVAEMHRVDGVIGIDMTELYRDFDPDGTPLSAGNAPGLGAESMKLLSDGTAVGAELLLLHPGPLDKIEVLP